MKIFANLWLIALLVVLACKPKEVDPAYLHALEQVASVECACNESPAGIESCDNPHPRFPSPPAGEPQAFLQYEATLSEASRAKIAAERAKLERCVAVRAQASAFKDVVDKRQEQILHPELD